MNDKKHNSHCNTCTQGWANFQNLTDEELEEVNKHRYEASYNAGEVIFKQGTPSSDIIFLVNGLVKMYIEGYDGKEIIIGLSGPSRMIAGPGTFVDNRHHYSVMALQKTQVCFIKTSILEDMIMSNNKFARGFLEDISNKSLRTFYKMISITQKKMHGRLAEGILYLSNEVFKNDKFEILLSRKELGDLTAMTKESVVRILKEFIEERVIHADCNSIEIIDKEKLERISQNG